jgi:hypothetical protein
MRNICCSRLDSLIRRVACCLAIVACMLLTTPFSSGVASAESPGWRPHPIRVGDGKGGWIYKESQCQILQGPESGWTAGFGIVQMDNGELALLATNNPGKSLWYSGGKGEQPLITFSSDGGTNWSEWQPLTAPQQKVNEVRPMLVAYLGNGVLTYKSGWITGRRHFSNDFGRTWEEPIHDPPVANGAGIGSEGNPLVEIDDDGTIHIAEIGYNLGGPGLSYDVREPEHGFFRWSHDGGRTWTDEVNPPNWYWDDTHNGKTWTRGISEGSLVRAKNGTLVASVRTGIPARGVEGPHNDQLEGTGISISKDNGQTWSPINFLYKTGRMHGHLLRMPNDDLILTMTVRADVEQGQLLSYRRGCEVVVSQDNGVTWDLDSKYILDEWEFHDAHNSSIGQCGHLCATLLDDGSILTIHNNYLTMGITLIKWQP